MLFGAEFSAYPNNPGDRPDRCFFLSGLDPVRNYLDRFLASTSVYGRF